MNFFCTTAHVQAALFSEKKKKQTSLKLTIFFILKYTCILTEVIISSGSTSTVKAMFALDTFLDFVDVNSYLTLTISA